MATLTKLLSATRIQWRQVLRITTIQAVLRDALVHGDAELARRARRALTRRRGA